MMNDDEEEKKIQLQILKEHSDEVVTRMTSHALESFKWSTEWDAICCDPLRGSLPGLFGF